VSGRSIRGSREEVGAASNMIMEETLSRLLRPKVFDGIGPEDVAHQAMSGRFSEAINLQSSYVSEDNGHAKPECLTFRKSSSVFSSGDKPP
jgi:hypothetical protein